MHTYFPDEQTAVVGVDEEANVDLAQSTKKKKKKKKKKKHRHQDSGRFYMSSLIKVQRKLQPFFLQYAQECIVNCWIKKIVTRHLEVIQDGNGSYLDQDPQGRKKERHHHRLEQGVITKE